MEKLLMGLLLILTVISCASQDKRNYCGNINRKDLAEIQNLPVFRETSSIKIGSFKGNAIPVKGGKIDISNFIEIKILDEEDKNKLLELLVNYDYDPKSVNIKSTAYFCYNPRNAILFVDKKDHIIGYVEICFECNGYKVVPHELIVGRFCDEKFELIKRLFGKSGVDYGIKETDHINEALDTINGLIKKDSSSSVLYSSRARLKMDKKDYRGALQDLNKSLMMDSIGRNYLRFFLRGHCKFELNDFVGAVKDFNVVIKFQPNITFEAYKERALANIKIYDHSSSPATEVREGICKDLQTVKHSGDNSVDDLIKIYCKK